MPSAYGCADALGESTKADNCVAWMAGYAPQLSTAVWLGTDDNTALRGADGTVLDSTVPAKAWQKFMTEYLKDKPVEQFPPFVPIGKAPH
jgi:membrane peptidoglycan carboxypeptidase